jgi:hypothetical protein
MSLAYMLVCRLFELVVLLGRRERSKDSATLVRNLLRAAGVPPAPQRGQLDWRSFLRAQAATTLACDFLTVDKQEAPRRRVCTARPYRTGSFVPG